MLLWIIVWHSGLYKQFFKKKNNCTETVQLLSKAYLRVQEWKQMEMETVVGWLSLKEGSEKREGIKGSKLQVEISTGLCP